MLLLIALGSFACGGGSAQSASASPAPPLPPECVAKEGDTAGSFTVAGACEGARLELRETPVLIISNQAGKRLAEYDLSDRSEGEVESVDYDIAAVVPVPGPESILVIHRRRIGGTNPDTALILLHCVGSEGCRQVGMQIGEDLEVEGSGPAELYYVERATTEAGSRETRYKLVFHDGKFVRTPG